ncbi:MAG TPA: NADP-dependent oxidoreductase, partial [Sphingomonas bacterium]|nr:NADP-dependent oxidoreductase [Sphingomonas bacterium]
KARGCRAVGIAGGKDKCDYVVNELGFDACIDYKADGMQEKFKAATPDRVDVYFENVGGAVWEAVFPLLNPYARVPVCGLIAHYNEKAGSNTGRDRLPGTMRDILTKSLTIRGFIQIEFADQRRDFYREAAQWIAEGRLKYKEDVVEGLENAPNAFIDLLRGRNFGKLVVKVA